MSQRNRVPYAPFGVGLAVALGLLGAGLQNHYRHPHSADHGATKQQQYATKNLPPAVVVPTPSYSPDPDPKPDRQEWRTEQDLQAQRDMAKWAFFAVIAAFVGACVTAVGVFLVWLTLGATRGMLDEAAKTTRAAEQTVEVQIRLERPLLFVAAIEVNLDMPERIDFTVQNLGKTPAILIEWSAQHNRSKTIPPHPNYNWIVPVKGTVLQTAGIEELMAWSATDETTEDAENVMVPIFFWGRFRYEDVLGRTHRTGFCYRAIFNALSRHYSWQRAGGTAYNYDHEESEG